jgi:hypothetical protein
LQNPPTGTGGQATGTTKSGKPLSLEATEIRDWLWIKASLMYFWNW